MENDVSNVAFLHIFALKIKEGGQIFKSPFFRMIVHTLVILTYLKKLQSQKRSMQNDVSNVAFFAHFCFKNKREGSNF